MKKIFIFIFMALMVVTASSVWAAQKVSAQGSAKMQNIIYGATIDSKACFYQKRIYLVDSEFKILSDIGKDAVKKIAFLTAYRQKLIDNMISKNIKHTTACMNSFLGARIHDINKSMEAYSTK